MSNSNNQNDNSELEQEVNRKLYNIHKQYKEVDELKKQQVENKIEEYTKIIFKDKVELTEREIGNILKDVVYDIENIKNYNRY